MLMVRQLAYYLALKMSCLPRTGILGVHFFSKIATARRTRSFYDVNISQGSVATRLRWGGIFNDCFIANFLENVTMKEFWKSASIWQSYV